MMMMKKLVFLLGLCVTSLALKNPMEDEHLYEGDMILTAEQKQDIENGGVNPNIPLAATKTNHWPHTIAWDMAPEIASQSRAVWSIKQAIVDYEKYTCLRFTRRTNESGYLYFYEGGGCSSPVGYHRRRNSISLSRGCWHKGTVMHEMAHSLGFYHEQSRPDRDLYVKILWKHIRAGLQYNFRKHSSRSIDSMNVPYDFRSVMHYGRTAFGNGRITIQTIDPAKRYLIGQRGGFSELDKLQVNLLYKCPGVTKPPPATFPTNKPKTEYIVSDTRKSWFDARRECRKAHGHLVTFENPSENSKIRALIMAKGSRDSYWTGLNDIESEGTFLWSSSGSPLPAFRNWDIGEPNGGSRENCVEMKFSRNLEWNDQPCNSTNRYICETAPTPKQVEFSIRHYDGKCVSIHQDGRLYLTTKCSTRFTLTHTKSLKHVASGKCVVPESHSNDAKLKLQSNCYDPNTRYEQTQLYSAKHILSGKCWHPDGGSIQPTEGTYVVIYDGCDQRRLRFKFEGFTTPLPVTVPTKKPTTAAPPMQGEFIIRHYGEKCVSINQEGRLYLTTRCTTRFTLTKTKSLKHVASGKCVVPESHANDRKFKLQTNCNDPNTRYEQTKLYSTKHILSGKCWHPFGGNRQPREGTYVVIYDGCDQSRLRFEFEGKNTLPPTQPPTFGPTFPPGQCGVSSVQSGRVIEGIDAKQGAWPWQILMLYRDRTSCGGSLVAPNWVVTAAHCVAGRENLPQNYKIRVGEHDSRSRDGKEDDIPVSKIISHPRYSSRALDSDIALMKLSRPAKMGKFVSTVCLPGQDRNVPVGTQCYITGWGKIHHPGSMHHTLQQGKFPVVSKQACSDLNTKTTGIKITDNMVCAGHGGSTRVSGCHGDSGGPFVCQTGSNGRWELHGAVSWGSGSCDATRSYTVFSRVAVFKNWLDQTMRSN